MDASHYINLQLFQFSSGDYFYLKCLFVVFIIFKLISIRQTSSIKLQYSKQNTLMRDFVEKSKISQMVYRPFWFTVTPLLQSLSYMMADAWYEYWHHEEFDRELIIAEDGGTLGIDWAYDKNTGTSRPGRVNGKVQPILLLAPGLGGGSRNLYTQGLMSAARKSGFRVGTILFRGANDLPMTSGKISHAGSWFDAKTVLEYVHQKYVVKEQEQGRRVALYCYACSLGAQILGLYLAKAGDEAAKIVDGAVLYGTPWSAKKGCDFFYNNMFGLYQKAIGINLSELIRKEQLPLIKEYMSEEDFLHYDNVLANNWQGLNALDEHVYPRMFGYADKEDYYEQVDLADLANRIRVPTFGFGAEDDQICGHFTAPVKAAQSPESMLCLGTTKFGAHVCHMQGHLKPKVWYQKPCLEFFEFLEARNTFKKKLD